jgi:putative Ca2+/H+ antiporter (TMEM165/GDT1 family)
VNRNDVHTTLVLESLWWQVDTGGGQMADFLTILWVAFFAQLAVLPGEKVQLIIAGLSTRYHPLGVVAAAGAAFAGWTALEIWFGQALRTALPGIVLDGLSAVLFLVFAILLARSAPAPNTDDPSATDGGMPVVEDVRLPVVDWKVPNVVGGYLPIFVMMAVGEFGDKTQIVTIGLAVEYGATSAIWFGEMLAIIPVSLANAYFFNRFSSLFDLRKAHFIAAGLFAFFAFDTALAMLTGFSFWETAVEGLANILTTAL